ncbi:dipeptide/oligopeptide/nickel ABC transporter ATP-binding protein [Dictyobacter alpinus]|uniref:Dipeptide/oligopeptide/nickel ABC transporter ATP-binding protein n=1 Tax=Dictyobacter alpinus TaxID=2014873 RepID=A0A402BAT0_9CHLR|nr:ABC transporter ATP-binding protein [Dictyobacter alpinus]GCE28455.1 dipeptide/oligopeptide/nickel ABC transporter ATP-binding protein [Dictyobacter alpinus]
MMTQDTSNLLLDIKNISVDYYAANGAVHAVRDVNLSLKHGEIVGLAGESGSGKSTLAYAISRLLRPPAAITGGQVMYYPHIQSDERRTAFTAALDRANISRVTDPVYQQQQAGVDILKLTPAQLRAFRWNELSIVFQSAMNALNPVMDIGTQITDVLHAHQPERSAQACKDRARELLKLVGISPDRIKSYPHELSGGMRQRVIIAIALALQPELIIMDEPTTALDVVVQREILDLISSLCKETGTALIFITHDLSLLLELVDRVAVMYAGKLVEVADRNNFYAHARHPYSYGLMNSFPTLHGPRRKMVGIAGSPPDLRNIPAGCPFHDRCPMAFDACHKVIPVLRTPVASAPEQIAACHLYDSKITGRTGIPAPSDLGRSYEMQAERNVVR